MDTIRANSSNTEVVTLLQQLLQKIGARIAVDGKFGSGTDEAVREYQRTHGLVSDGVVGKKTWAKLFSQSAEFLSSEASKYLSESDIEQFARRFDLEPAVVKAVNEVESSGRGFVGGKPRILFEGHVFWRRLEAHGIDPAAQVGGNEDILYRRWTKQFYLGGIREYERLDRARAIQRQAADESASWGLFQVMGYHYRTLNYPSIEDFVRRMDLHEREHLDAFGRFLEANKLIQPLRDRQWAVFARGYNGPGYRENRYDEKLERAYRRQAPASQS